MHALAAGRGGQQHASLLDPRFGVGESPLLPQHPQVVRGRGSRIVVREGRRQFPSGECAGAIATVFAQLRSVDHVRRLEQRHEHPFDACGEVGLPRDRAVQRDVTIQLLGRQRPAEQSSPVLLGERASTALVGRPAGAGQHGGEHGRIGDRVTDVLGGCQDLRRRLLADDQRPGVVAEAQCARRVCTDRDGVERVGDGGKHRTYRCVELRLGQATKQRRADLRRLATLGRLAVVITGVTVAVAPSRPVRVSGVHPVRFAHAIGVELGLVARVAATQGKGRRDHPSRDLHANTSAMMSGACPPS